MGILAGLLDGVAQVLVKLLPYIVMVAIFLSLFGIIISFLPVFVDPDTLESTNFWNWLSGIIQSAFWGVFSMEVNHLLALIPFVVCFLIFIFIWRKGIIALCVVGYSMAMIYYSFLNAWEWFVFPLEAIVFLISMYMFIRLAMEGELI